MVVSWVFAFLVYAASQGSLVAYTQCIASNGRNCRSLLDSADFEFGLAIILSIAGAIGCVVMILGKYLRRKPGDFREYLP